MYDEFIIKHNIAKGPKTVIDIGTDSTKLLKADYTSKRIKIHEAHLIKIGYNGETSFSEIAETVADKLDYKEKKNIIVALPSALTESKIVAIKNKRKKDAEKIARKQCINFARSNPLTHVVDAVFIGSREEQGDTIAYYLISSVLKSNVTELITAFDDFGITISRIVSNAFNQVCLSEIFANDFDNINRILVDFGNTESKIMVFADKVGVYTRTIPIGFQSYVKKLFDENNTAGKKEILSALINIGEAEVDEEKAKEKLFNIGKSFYYESISEINKLFFKDFARILDMCTSSDIEVTKVYLSGYILDGFLESFTNNTEIECELIHFEPEELKVYQGIVIDIETENPLNSRFTNAVGLSLCPLL